MSRITAEGVLNLHGVKLLKHSGKRFECLCPCGKPFSILRGEFKRQKSCGCARKSRTKPWGVNRTTVPSRYMRGLYKNALSRNLPFDVSPEYLEEIFISQKGRCALSGVTIELANKENSMFQRQTASVDRIAPTQGYVYGNVQWVHKAFNTMKWTFTSVELAVNSLLVWNHLGMKVVKSSLPEDSQHLAPVLHASIQSVVPGYLTQAS